MTVWGVILMAAVTALGATAIVLTERWGGAAARDWERVADLWEHAAQQQEEAAAAWQRAANIRNNRGGA